MKSFIAVVVFNVVLAINAREIDLKLEEKCLKEIGVDQDIFKAALEKKVEDADINIKCMSRCMMKENKMINEDGTFNVQQIAAALFMESENVEVAKPLIESCIKGGDKSAEKKEGEAKSLEKKEGDDKSAEKKEGEGKEAEKKEGEDTEAEKRKREAKESEEIEEEEVEKKEPSCEEAYEMMLCVTKKIEEALKDD